MHHKAEMPGAEKAARRPSQRIIAVLVPGFQNRGQTISPFTNPQEFNWRQANEIVQA
jgi:hypothetical protein